MMNFDEGFFAPGAKYMYCDVCPLPYFRNHMAELHQILCILPVFVARYSSDDVAIRYVLPVLWMTTSSLFRQVGSMMGQVCCLARRQRNSRSCCFHSNQILLNDNDNK